MSYKNHNKQWAGILCSVLLAGMIGGCSTGTEAAGSKEFSSTETSESSITIAALDAASMFTDRDKSASYDAKEVIDVTLTDNACSCSSSSVKTEGSTVTIQKEGCYRLTGKLSNGQIIVDADSEKVQLILDNADINCDTSAAIYVRQADKVFLTLAENSSNTLSNKKDFVSLEDDDTNIDAVIFSKDDLVITGGNYQITAAKHALSGKDSVRVADGTLTLDAGSDGIHGENTEDEEKGFIYVAGGNLNITSVSDGLDAEETLQIDGGTMKISAGDDGVHSDVDLIINDGNIQITKSYEGLEGTTITLNGGSCDIKSEDDGLNAANTDTGSDTPHQKERPQKPDFDENSMPEPPSKDETQDASGTPKMPSGSMKRGGKGGGMDQVDDACLIQICAGTLTVDAGGDGIDSNGNLTISGGEIHVYGPTNSGNGALDYAGTASISGGTIVAVGASGMAQNFGEDSTQGSMLVTVSDSQLTGELVLTDSKEQTLVSCSPAKEYNSVLISCPELKNGETYTLTTGDTTTTVEMTSLVYGTGEQGQRGLPPVSSAGGDSGTRAIA
ncbi:MAG: carbohydrate-binding domain-containing protein [Agathobacter sp.]